MKCFGLIVMSKSGEYSEEKIKMSPQRKTTMKWSNDGELSSLDMARILDKLAKPELTKCDLSCDVEDNNSVS